MARVPPTMRAALLRSFGGPDVLQVVRDAPTPRCGPNDVLVRVAAAAVNPLDARVRGRLEEQNRADDRMRHFAGAVAAA